MFNKIDLLPADDVEACCEKLIEEIGWQGPYYKISAVRQLGTQQICYDLMNFLESE